MSSPGALLDTLHSVETPEGVDLRLRAAGPALRATAWLVDMLVMGLALSILGFVLIFAGAFTNLFAASMGLLLLLVFLLNWFYPVYFEVWHDGQTPGKRVTDLRVVCDDGTPVTLSRSIARNFLRVADMLPTGYAVGLICCLIDPSFRRLGDLAAGTLVVYASPIEHQTRFDPGLAPLTPPVSLDLNEERALISFAERSALLTPERADELAQILLPLTGRDRPREKLVRMAAWLQGRHR